MKKSSIEINSFNQKNELQKLSLNEEYVENFSEEDLLDENEELYKWLGILLGIIWILSIFFY